MFTKVSSVLGGRYKIILAIIALALFGNVLINTAPTSAAELPKIFKAPPGGSAWVGFFHGVTNTTYTGGNVIRDGFTGAYTYTTELSKVPGGGPGVVVKDNTGTRFSANVKDRLYSGDSRDSVGAAYIIFTMLGKSGSDSGSDPVGTAKTLFTEWQTMVDAAFDENRVVRYIVNSPDSSGVYNTLWNQKALPASDVAWYLDKNSGKNFDSLLFLNSASDNSLDAAYAIRIKCGNPLGGGGEPCRCTTGEEECCPDEPDPIPIPPKTCPLDDSEHSIEYGGTQVQSAVKNLTARTEWVKTDGKTSTAKFVWAKPGDSVRFMHTVCYGVQEVRGSSDTGSESPAGPIKPDKPTTASITASSKPSSGGKYLFGNSLNGGTTQSFTVPAGAAKPTSGSPDESEDYWFRYYSPGNNSNGAYSCYDSSLGFPPFMTNGYQIPDFASTSHVPANCNSSKKAGVISDAGRVIQQTLKWNNLRAWQYRHNESVSGSCGGSSCTNSASSQNASHSYEDMKAGKYRSGERVYKCVTESSTGCGWCNRQPVYGLRDYRYYPMKTEQLASADQIVQVKIPFNYTTTNNVTTPQSELFDGGEYSVNVSTNTNVRANDEVSGDSYSTITKNTSWEIVAFTVAPDTGFGSIAHENTKKPGSRGDGACSYYSKGATACETLDRKDNVRFNEKGSLLGATNQLFSGTLGVPDAEVGTKFCVAVGVFPSDSHNFTGGAAGSGDTALDIANGQYWNYSEPTCRTITKKPTVQIRSAGAYTQGKITTSQTKKTVSYNFGSRGDRGELQSGAVGEGSSGNRGLRTVFGSFTEYETITKLPAVIEGFASGAGFGYGLNNGGNLASGAALHGGYPNVPFNTEANICTYSTQTFNNDKCAQKVTGAANIDSMGPTILNRLKERYTNNNTAATQNHGNISFGNYQTLENGAKYIKINGDATIASSFCMNQGNVENSNTFVIEVSGKLTINGNIKYGSGSGNSCNYQNYNNIAELPQMLIFADEVNIHSAVSTIDAWLIVGQQKTNTTSGIINTCYDMSGSQIGKGHTVPPQTNSVPCNSPLTVNGPVFAKKLILNRNAGAGVGNASINAAEIFNLRPDTYLWAFNQASRFSQAVTTYQRELSPRY